MRKTFMDQGRSFNRKRARPLIRLLLGTLLVVLPVAQAKQAAGLDGPSQRYVVEFHDPPLAAYDGRALSSTSRGGKQYLAPTSVRAARAAKLDLHSAAAAAYLDYLAERHAAFEQELRLRLARAAAPLHRYRLATNGVALDLTSEEAALLADSSLVKSITVVRPYYPETYASAQFLGAGRVWEGMAGFPAARGENMIIGIIDSGINFESPSFVDPTLGGYSHSNPLGEQLGLCSEPEVECSNKLIGVYDFVEDFPWTDDVVEESTNGRDVDGHGSHVSSIAAGNPVNILLDGRDVTFSGVAPRANIVVYRVCWDLLSGCDGTASLSAIEQAIADGVHVLNLSNGGDTGVDPWRSPIARALLNAREAGIFVATSAGNSGPGSSTLTDPAPAPWVTSVGSATHDQTPVGSIVQDLAGGATEPPADLIGVSQSEGIGVRRIVHAREYGNALCGIGEPELQGDCDDNTGASNPWDGETPFNGEIVVCDRGTYGRVEKGKNVLLAGAGGYILANSDGWDENVVADEHCLPASHIGLAQGDLLRDWLATGSGHEGSISGTTPVASPYFGDQVSIFSSRGPAPAPAQNVLKPNLIAPGWFIWGATQNEQEYAQFPGTSMSSPQIAGAAALLRSVHPDWSVSQLSSVIETTATPDYATDDLGFFTVNPLDYGAGRPQLDEAVNAGLFLDVADDDWLDANPSFGGDPQDLNLAGLVDTECEGVCSFSRTVTDQMGGANWTATPVDFPAGVGVSISPSNFQLAANASQDLQIDVNVQGFGVVGQWVSGRVRLSAAGAPDQYLTVLVGGQLPEEWVIEDDRNGGYQEFELARLPGLADATFRSGGLQPAGRRTEVLPQDPTRDDPYDDDQGVFTQWHEMPQGALWLHARTLSSTAEDLDLFVGLDANGDGLAEEFEELCSSTTPDDLEQCDLYELPAGNYWILVQNWAGTDPDGDEVTLLSAAIAPETDGTMAVTGPGIVAADESFKLRLSWDNVSALPGEEWLGAVSIGTDRDSPGDIGMIPVRFQRSGISPPATHPLYRGVDHGLALPAGASHDRLFIDVPPGASSLTVSASAREAGQNAGLTLELRRLAFEDALVDPPFAVAPTGAAVVASASGEGTSGPTVTVSGASLQAGRWYAVLGNGNAAPVAVALRADVELDGGEVPVYRGHWYPGPGVRSGRGYEYNWGSGDRAFIWYDYGENGQPTWYSAGGPASGSDIWVADLYRVSNDGVEQQLTEVGKVSVTNLAEDDQLFSFTLFGQSGTDRMTPLAAQTCPQVDGVEQSYTGHWYPGKAGLGGATVVVNAATQGQIHYLFDAAGAPRWLLAQDPSGSGSPTDRELPMLQYSLYCSVCAPMEQTSTVMGLLTRDFTGETSGSWKLDYVLEPPLVGSMQRTDQIVKLTTTNDCQ
jgi:hypothetical protein